MTPRELLEQAFAQAQQVEAKSSGLTERQKENAVIKTTHLEKRRELLAAPPRT